MSKVVITLGDKPADCTISVDGKLIQNVLSIDAFCDSDKGPSVRYMTINSNYEKISYTFYRNCRIVCSRLWFDFL